MVMDGKRSCSTDAGSVPGEKLTQLKTNVEASNDALGNCKFANLEMLRFLLLTKNLRISISYIKFVNYYTFTISGFSILSLKIKRSGCIERCLKSNQKRSVLERCYRRKRCSGDGLQAVKRETQGQLARKIASALNSKRVANKQTNKQTNIKKQTNKQTKT